MLVLSVVYVIQHKLSTGRCFVATNKFVLQFLLFLTECNCDPAGVPATFTGCGTLPPGELCKCKDRVHGRICNECRPLFWNLQAANPEGCEGWKYIIIVSSLNVVRLFQTRNLPNINIYIFLSLSVVTNLCTFY